MRKNPIKLDRIERKRMEQFANYWTDSNSYKAKIILTKIKVILMRDDNKSIDYIIKETGLGVSKTAIPSNKDTNSRFAESFVPAFSARATRAFPAAASALRT